MLSRPVPVRHAVVVGWRAGGGLTLCDVSTALFAAASLLLLLNAMVLPQGEYGCGKEARRGREERKEGGLGRQGSGRGGRGEGPVYIRSPLCALFDFPPPPFNPMLVPTALGGVWSLCCPYSDRDLRCSVGIY